MDLHLNEACAEIPAQVHICLKNGTIIALLEDYCKFLKHTNNTLTADDLKQAVGKICSAAIEVGDISVGVIEHVNSWIDAKADKHDNGSCMFNKFLKHTLCEEIPELQLSNLPPEIASKFERADKLRKELKAQCDELVNLYGGCVKQHAVEFYNKYANCFEPTFQSVINSI